MTTMYWFSFSHIDGNVRIAQTILIHTDHILYVSSIWSQFSSCCSLLMSWIRCVK